MTIQKLAVALAACGILFLTACGGGPTGPNPTPSGSGGPPPPTREIVVEQQFAFSYPISSGGVHCVGTGASPNWFAGRSKMTVDGAVTWEPDPVGVSGRIDIYIMDARLQSPAHECGLSQGGSESCPKALAENLSADRTKSVTYVWDPVTSPPTVMVVSCNRGPSGARGTQSMGFTRFP